MLTRFFLSIIAVVVVGAVDAMLAGGSTIALGHLSTLQFDNSDASYLAFIGGDHLIRTLGSISLVAIALLAIWWRPLRSAFAVTALAVLAFVLAPEPRAFAYYDQSDYAEVYFILPNESAFFIPDVGANKDSQAAFGSEAYLQDNKIAAKRYEIKHTKLSNSGLWSNYYVPVGRLIIVDRTPYSREWVSSETRGSSKRDESFPCQSKEGLDISVGIAIGASVYEQDAAKFLYRFGVKSPAGDRGDPKVIFTSVFYGRSLAEVMDGPVRNKIQSLVCQEFTRRSFTEANAQAADIMADVEKSTKAYLGGVGIALDYIGWADTFTFDKTVQDAVNRRYVATQDEEIARLLGPHTTTIQALAVADALRIKWDGKAPSTVSLWWLPEGLSSFMGGLFGAKPVASPVPAR